MKFTVCSIFDKQSKEYSQPFYTPNRATAQRELMRLRQDPQSAVHAFPDDYELYIVGEFDTETGYMHSVEADNITP